MSDARKPSEKPISPFEPPFHIQVGRTLAHLHAAEGRFTGVSIPCKSPEQRDLATRIVVALNAAPSHD